MRISDGFDPLFKLNTQLLRDGIDGSEFSTFGVA